MINIKDIAFVRYQVTDLDEAERFLLDFGLHRADRDAQRLYMRAAGPAHHVHISELGPENTSLGIGLLADSLADLEKLATDFGSVVELNPEPGGGYRVRLRDPEGFMVDVIHGQATHAPLPVRAPVELNFDGKRRRLGQTVRTEPKPSSVMRLGHVALLVANFPKTYAFYQEVFGLSASDTYWAGEETNTIAAFMHCKRGKEWTDHHTIALITSQDGQARFDHSAFEVLDLDDVMQGNEYLKSRNYQHSWGVGRHIQGSQIFDYWRDPFGNKIEHWTDGDLVNEDTPTGHAPISPEELRQWAPPLTPEFFK